MTKNLSNYEEIETDDGSVTVFSKRYGEACHSKAGAALETKLHYVKGCDVVNKAKIKEITIFETGFGIGVGFEETFKAINNYFTFITTEIDDDLIKYVISKNEIYKDIVKKDVPLSHYFLDTKDFKLIILQGDARLTVPMLKDLGDIAFDCIYQDAFSPKKNAILWTTQWFELLRSYAKDDCIMSTYSSSSSIRKSMIAAGWKIYNGEKFGLKRSSTRARLIGESDQDVIDHLERSPAITITDDNYRDYTMDKV